MDTSHEYVHACAFAHMHTHTTRMRVHAHAHIHTHMYVRAQSSTHPIHPCTHILTNTSCVYMHGYLLGIHTCTSVHTHTHTPLKVKEM
eukprot:c10623_g1_i2 orf=202-465(-)